MGAALTGVLLAVLVVGVIVAVFARSRRVEIRVTQGEYVTIDLDDEKYRASVGRELTLDEVVRSSLQRAVQSGRLVFNPPAAMQLRDAARVEVRVTRSLDLDTDLLAELRGCGLPELETIPTSVFMGVSLHGPSFDIVTLSDLEQVVTDDSITTWEFNVQPLVRGHQLLILSVSLRFPIAGRSDERLSIPVLERLVDVQVSAMSFIVHFASSNWQWLIATSVGLAGAITAWDKLVR